MTTIFLTLENLSYALADGRVLFSSLNETFDQRRTGLVGRNGVGKSVLAQIMAGQLSASSGRCLGSGPRYYLAQQISTAADATIATLAGVKPQLDALGRIEAGSCDEADFAVLNERWDIRQRLQATLEQHGLGHLAFDTPATQLSGGEAMRVMLSGAWLAEADFLILDEPSNHLDHAHRQALLEQLPKWPRGLIVISHDRQLLDSMERIIELSAAGLTSYGGNYSFYAEAKQREQQSAMQHLEQLKLERKREVQSMREQQERQDHRQARGNRHGKESNQAKIALDRHKEKAETTNAKLQRQQAASKQQLDQRVREAAQNITKDIAINLHAVATSGIAQRRLAELNAVQLPFLQGAAQQIELQIYGQQRIGVIGANGSGKSTLLKVLAGQLAPIAGTCSVNANTLYLDQRLGNLDPQQTVLEQLQAVNRNATESELRMRLAQLDLDTDKITVPSGNLSGGEQLKATLACVLYADPAPQLLLLDEPSNHLDLASLQALEAMLRSYQGALMVVSHDAVFLNNIGLSHRLTASPNGWQLDIW